VLRVMRVLYKNKNLKRVLQTVFGSGEARVISDCHFRKKSYRI
jgi:hypothetical protein